MSLAVPRRRTFALSFRRGPAMALGSRTRVMGIVNVTPDSFSDGGRRLEPQAAIDAALEMVADGADLIDIGGESTRPGAAAVEPAEELRRVLPVVEGLAGRLGEARISIDTMKAAVAAEALDAGADLVNDVSALADPAMLATVVAREAPIVLMHMRGTPRTMQRDTDYDDVVAEVAAHLGEIACRAVGSGVDSDKIVLDPGIGFGKSLDGNVALLAGLSRIALCGWPLLVGASRKSFLGKMLDLPVDDRLEPGLAVAGWAAARGAHILRVHDVRQTVRIVRTVDALLDAEAGSPDIAVMGSNREVD